ncbi:MAG: ABC transporter substrate-binding protein [Armatimonadota bacterium]|nr:ABC transporter substrate-binding protein [Armatimonadota bacterium]
MKYFRLLADRRLAQLVVAIALAASPAAWAAPAAWNPAFADTVRVAWGQVGAIDNLDPGTARGVPNWRLVMETYETLAHFPDGATEPQPLLAESFRRLEGGRIWEFRLRRGIKFTTGSEVTAEAVRYSIDRAMEIGLGAIFPLEGLYERTEVVDQYTVRFHLRASSLAWPCIVANPVILGIIDPQFVQRNGGITRGRRNDYVSTHTAGTGPFILEDLRANQRVTFKRNPDYWRGWSNRPRLERVVIQIVPEESTRLLLIERGDVDIAEIGATALPGLKQRIRAQSLPLAVVERDASGRPLPSLSMMWINMNNKMAPTSDINVRKGLAHSFNYDQFIKQVLNGYARRARTIVPSGSSCYMPDAPAYEYDLNKAKAAFAEASPDAQRGLRDGLVFRYQQDYVVQREGALMWQADLAKIGVNLRIEEVDAATWLRFTRTPPGAPLLEARWFGSYPDAEYFMHPYRTGYWPPVGFGASYAGNAETDAMIDAARTAGTMEQRCNLYRRIATRFYNEAALLLIAEVDGAIHPFNVQANWVRGFVYNPATTAPSVFYPMSKQAPR